MVRVQGGISADISDRAARSLGKIRQDSSQGTLIDANPGVNIWPADQNGNIAPWGVYPLHFNGTTWDRLRNLRAANPKYALSIGDPRYAFVQGANAYYGTADFERPPTAATNYVIWRLRNPAASGKQLVVTYILVLCNTARELYIVTSTVGVDRGTALTEMAKGAGGAAATGIASVDANAVVPPGIPFFRTRFQANVPITYTEPIRIAAGEALDVSIGDGGSLTTDRMTLNVEWGEEA